MDTFPEDMYGNMRTWFWAKDVLKRQERNAQANINIEAVK